MNSKIKSTLHCFSGMLLLQLSCCKREKPKDPITIEYKLGEIKDYMFFKRGTYWVYEHSITGQIDSQYVTSAAISRYTSKGREDYSKHITLIQETFNMRIRSNFKDGWGSVNYFNIYSNGQRVDAYPYPEKAYVFKRTKVPNIILGPSTGNVFRYPYYTGANYSPYQDSFLINYQLKGSTYDTVRVFVVGSAESVMQQSKILTQGTPVRCYYAKNVGIIKLHQKDYRVFDGSPIDHSWNLIRKKIIR